MSRNFCYNYYIFVLAQYLFLLFSSLTYFSFTYYLSSVPTVELIERLVQQKMHSLGRGSS